jgi:GntR family transcriptional regulator, rspAB operon transcriptional repressor
MQSSKGLAVYELLRDDILSGFYKPGQAVREVELAERHGVSRTPVRDAVQRLGAEGLVTLVPRSAILIREISARDVAEIFQIREALEGFAVAVKGASIDRAGLQRLSDGYAAMDAAKTIGEDVSPPEVFEYSVDTELHRLIVSALGNSRINDVMRIHTQQIARLRALFWRLANQEVDERMALSCEKAASDHRQLVDKLLAGDYEEAHTLLVAHLRRAAVDLIYLVSTVDLTTSPVVTTNGPAVAPYGADVPGPRKH